MVTRTRQEVGTDLLGSSRIGSRQWLKSVVKLISGRRRKCRVYFRNAALLFSQTIKEPSDSFRFAPFLCLAIVVLKVAARKLRQCGVSARLFGGTN